MSIDISTLSAEDIEKLRSVLGMTPTQEQMRQGRRRELTDLRAPSTQAGRLYRPHFEWSADDPGGQVIKPFPRLYWDENGVEGRFESQADMDTRMQKHWSLTPPNTAPLSKQQQIERELAMLSPEDREWLLEAQKKQRMDRLQELVSGMSAEALTDAMAATAPPIKGRKTA